MSNEFITYGEKMVLVSQSGLRLEFNSEEYRGVEKKAKQELFDHPNLVLQKIKQILVPNELSNSDRINLLAVKLFPKQEDDAYFRLVVRLLSTDIPSAKLNTDELNNLKNALMRQGFSFEELQNSANSILN